MERNVVFDLGRLARLELEAGNDHPRDPKENNIWAGHENAGWIEFLSRFRVHRLVGPKPGRKPGIKRVFVLRPTFARRCDLNAGFISAIPRWNSMSPPNLAADAPVLNVREPLLVNFLPMLREEADEMFFNNRERFLRFRIMQKPLLAESRLDRDIAAVAEANIVLVGLGFRKQSPFLQ